MKTWRPRILLALGGAVLLAALWAAFWPLPTSPALPPEKWGAGAASVAPAYSGLKRAFPAINAADVSTPEKIALGRLLFYDPILSQNQDLSCAHCHHPDLGFADGLPVAQGAGATGAGHTRTGGIRLTRATLSLWNVAYDSVLFWDGRATSLEEQMVTPLTHADEMNISTGEIETRLKALPAYAPLFEQAYGANAVTFANVQSAIAAFERTLISNQSPFDRYAEGNFDALTAQQRHGLALFRSAATRCFECHAAPTFGQDNFFVIGVPDGDLPHDPGRQGVQADGRDGAFKAPTLRNIALTAPYMHNGRFQTLDEVLDFYAQGGGRAEGLEGVDRQVIGFDLSAQDQADLIAFLYALTDESALTAIPTSVPSGLAVVPPIDNPARQVVAAANIQLTAGAPPAHTPTTIRLQPGETLQQLAYRAGPGDTVEVPYGLYKESMVLDWSDIKLVGLPNDKGEWPILDGEGIRSDGVIASGNNFEMHNFAVKNYLSNGVLVEGATGVYLHDLYIENTGVYGVYPVRSTKVLIERVVATQMNDAGIYAGKSQEVIIRDCEVYANVIGIELENTVNGEVYNNHAHDNTVGIFIDLLPQLPSKVSLNTKVYNNLAENNNGENFSRPGSAPALIPPGTGMLILAADNVEVYSNTIRGNKSGGLAVFNLAIGFAANEIDVDPSPDHLRAHGNQYSNNGHAPDPFVKNMLGNGFDIIWDGSGLDNRFDESGVTSFPPALPSPAWPEPAYNLYWRVLNWVVSAVS
jgi:parallel beta-helix repeat protein